MKRALKSWMCSLLLLPFLSAAAADRIAVANPQVKGGIKETEVAGFSDYIESRLGSKYELFSRSALKAIVKEWEFNQSGLVLDDSQRSALEQKSVHLLVVPTIAKAGDRISFTLLTVDPVTGRADPRHRAALQVSSLSDLFRRLDQALTDAGLREKDEKPALRKLALLPVTAAAGVTLDAGTAAEITARLGERLLKSGSFEVLSREDLDRLTKEAKLAASELADPAALSKLGNLKIADDIAVIHVSRFQTRLRDGSTAIAGRASPRVLVDISLQVRLVDGSTGTIAALENVDSHLDSRNIPADVRRDWSEEDYRSEAIRRMTLQAAEQVVNALDPLMVAAVEGKTVYLSRGEGSAVKPGAVYRLSAPGKKLVHPRTGKVIGSTERDAGDIRVSDVQPGFSTAERIRSAGEIPAGTVCRLLSAPEKASDANPESAPAYPKAQ